MCCNFCKPLRVQIAVKFQVSTCNLAIPLALKCLKHESLLTFVESVRLAGVPLFTLRPHPTEIREGPSVPSTVVSGVLGDPSSVSAFVNVCYAD